MVGLFPLKFIVLTGGGFYILKTGERYIGMKNAEADTAFGKYSCVVFYL